MSLSACRLLKEPHILRRIAELAEVHLPRDWARATACPWYDESWERKMPRILDGAAIAAAIKQEVAAEVRLLAAQGIRPGLAAVLVGSVGASEIYVRSSR